MSEPMNVQAAKPVTGHAVVDAIVADLDEPAADPAQMLARLRAAHEALHRVLIDGDHAPLPTSKEH